MNTSEFRQQAEKLLSKLTTLTSQHANPLKDVINRLSTLPVRHGVYAISPPDDRAIIYIGKSKAAKGKLLQRLKNHLQKEALQTYGATKEQVENFLVRYVEEEDTVIRGHFEKFAISIIRPELNKD